MSKRADGLMADFLDNRWVASDSATNVTITANVGAPSSAKASRILDALSICVANMNAAGATITAHVRDVSFAGTILAQWRLFVPGSTTAHVNPANLGIVATRGKGLHFTTDTVIPSVTASVTATGWTDESTDY